MKIWFLLLALLISNNVFGQGDPAPFVKGQSSSGLGNNSSTIFVPYNQSTKINAYQSLLETGNDNLLVNPSFEGTPVGIGWSLGASNTLTATTTSANLFSGKQAGLLTTNATAAFNLSQCVTPVSGLAGTQGEVTWAISVPTGVTDAQICSQINNVDQTCVPAINNGIYNDYSIPTIFGTSGQNTCVKIKTTATYASGTQTILVDRAKIKSGLSGAIVQPSPSNILRVGLTSNQAVSAGAMIKYDARLYDPRNAYSASTGLWTAPDAGYYKVCITASQSSATSTTFYVVKTGVQQGYLTAQSSTLATLIVAGCNIVQVVAGDTIGISMTVGITVAGAASPNFQASMDISREDAGLIYGSLSGYPSITGYSGKTDTFSFSYGTTNLNTVCSASPCFVNQEGSAISSNVWNSAGDMTFALSRSYAILKCVGNSKGASVVTELNPMQCTSCSSLQVTSVSTANIATNSFGTITCTGTY